MRFNTVEVERAYMDYLDSLDDWPPPQGMSAETAAALRQTADPDERLHSLSRPASNPLHS